MNMYFWYTVKHWEKTQTAFDYPNNSSPLVHFVCVLLMVLYMMETDNAFVPTVSQLSWGTIRGGA